MNEKEGVAARVDRARSLKLPPELQAQLQAAQPPVLKELKVPPKHVKKLWTLLDKANEGSQTATNNRARLELWNFVASIFPGENLHEAGWNIGMKNVWEPVVVKQGEIPPPPNA